MFLACGGPSRAWLGTPTALLRGTHINDDTLVSANRRKRVMSVMIVFTAPLRGATFLLEPCWKAKISPRGMMTR